MQQTKLKKHALPQSKCRRGLATGKRKDLEPPPRQTSSLCTHTQDVTSRWLPPSFGNFQSQSTGDPSKNCGAVAHFCTRSALRGHATNEAEKACTASIPCLPESEEVSSKMCSGIGGENCGERVAEHRRVCHRQQGHAHSLLVAPRQLHVRLAGA